MGSVSSLNSLLSSSSASSAPSVDISSLLSAASGSASTGIDVTAAVNAAVYAAQAPERQWQAEQATLQSQITALHSIQTATTALSADLAVLNDPVGPLASRAVNSSNPSAVSATASPGTAVGPHTVSVISLATSASWYSPVVAGAGASLGSSALTITQGDGTQTSFGLGSSGSNTLSSLVSSINAAKLGITASIVQDASGSRLALVGNNTGTRANFTVADGSSTVPAWSSAEVADASASLSASSFQIGDGNSSATINVSTGSTLADVASQINAQGLNLSASVVTDSAGAHLSILSSNGGSVTVGSDPVLTFTQASQGANASLKVDGVPVSSASNTVTGAITGMTLNLAGITPNLAGGTSGGQVTLGVAADTNTIDSTISQFVTDYNSSISSIASQFTYNVAAGSQGALGSDASVRTLQGVLLGIGGYSASSSGSSNASAGNASTLASLGITMNDDGTMSLNTGALNQAIAANSASVQNFFQGSAQNGFAASVQAQLKTFTKPSAGTLAVDQNSLTQQYNNLQSDVNNFEAGYIASQKTRLTSMYSQAEIALQALPTTLKQLQAELGNNSGG